MTLACLEHLNVTVSDPDHLATLFCELFEWKVRWSGPAKDNGYTVHVGTDNRYLALYTHPESTGDSPNLFVHGMANHVGLVVKDSEAMEQKIIAKGYTTKSHNDYGYCKSFYFMADKVLEVEIVCYKEQ